MLKVLITKCSVSIIDDFEAYYLDQKNMQKTLRFDSETKTVKVGSSKRIVLDLLQSTFITKGRLSYSGIMQSGILNICQSL